MNARIPATETYLRFAKITAALCAGLLPTFGVGAVHAAGTNLETFVMATNGQSNYSVYRVPDPVYNTFGSWGSGIPFNAVSAPAPLAGDGISGTFRTVDSASASSLTDSLSTAGTGLSGFGSWNYSGNTTTTAQYGQLKSGSQATHTGNSDNATVNSAESFSTMAETFNPTSASAPNGSSGTMTIGIKIDGSLSINGTGSAGLLLRYGGSNNNMTNPGHYLLETFAYTYGNGIQVYGPHSSYGTFTAPPGMSYTIGPTLPSGAPAYATFGGTSTVYASIPVVFGATNTFTLGMMTWTGIGNGSGTMSSLFQDTATISGIQLFDSGNNQIDDFSIASGSGTVYDASGVHLAGAATAPEPGSMALLAVGVLPFFRIAKRRRSGDGTAA